MPAPLLNNLTTAKQPALAFVRGPQLTALALTLLLWLYTAGILGGGSISGQLGDIPALCTKLQIKKDYNIKDLKCTKIGHLEDYYTIDKTLGHGFEAEAKLLTHKKTGLQYIARFMIGPYAADYEAYDAAEDINMAKRACGSPFLMQLADVKCHNKNVILIWSNCEGVPLVSLFPPELPGCPSLEPLDVKIIMKQLIQAVVFMYKNRLSHGDVTAGNIKYQPSSGKLCLIDYGHAELLPRDFDSIKQKQSTEIMIRNMTHKALYKEDTFAVGCLFLKLLSIPAAHKQAKQGFNHMWTPRQLVKFLGLNEHQQYIEEYSNSTAFIVVAEQDKQDEELPLERSTWKEYSNDCNAELLTAETLDLLNGLLQYGFIDRWEFLQDAIEHPYFAP